MNKKYYSIYLDVKTKILQGDYQAGEKLPSKRVMADKMGCSIVTVENAYAMLEEEGYIHPRERSGYFVEKIDLSLGAMRMEYMILPEALISAYNDILGKFSCSVPVLDQYVLAEFINSGSFERHLNRMRRKIKPL